MAALQAAGVSASGGVRRAAPAQLTRMSTGPRHASMASTRAVLWSTAGDLAAIHDDLRPDAVKGAIPQPTGRLENTGAHQVETQAQDRRGPCRPRPGQCPDDGRCRYLHPGGGPRLRPSSLLEP